MFVDDFQFLWFSILGLDSIDFLPFLFLIPSPSIFLLSLSPFYDERESETKTEKRDEEREGKEKERRKSDDRFLLFCPIFERVNEVIHSLHAKCTLKKKMGSAFCDRQE